MKSLFVAGFLFLSVLSIPSEFLAAHQPPVVNRARDHKRPIQRFNADIWTPVDGEINLDPETYTGKSITLAESLEIYGDDDFYSTIQVTAGVVYSNPQYHLELYNLIFEPTPSFSNLEKSLIVCGADAELEMHYVTFTSLTLKSSPLLVVSAAIVEEVVFKDITRQSLTEGSKGGSVLELTSFASHVYIQGTFENCKCPGGLGGAIYAKIALLADDDEDEPKIPLYIQASFTNCDAATGKCIYLDFDALKVEEIPDAIDCFGLITPQTDGYHVFVAKDVTTPRNVYTLYEDQVSVIGTSGSADKTKCGSVSSPCSTLAVTLESTKYNAKTEEEYNIEDIAFLPGTHPQETATSTFTRRSNVMAQSLSASDTVITVASVGDKKPIIVLAASSSTGEFSVSFGFLSFVTSGTSASTVFMLTSADNVQPSLYLVHTNFENSAFSASVINGAAGRVTLESVSFSKITLSDCPLFKINTKSSSFSPKSCSFQSVTRTTGNGAIAEETLTSDTDVDFSNLGTISDCAASSGMGLFYFKVGDDVAGAKITGYSDKRTFCELDPSQAYLAIAATSRADIYDESSQQLKITLDSSSKRGYSSVLSLTTPKITAALEHLTSEPYRLYVSTTAVSDDLKDYCGWEDIPCGVFKDYVKNSGSFDLSSGTHVADGVITLTDTLNIYGPESSYMYWSDCEEPEPAVLSVKKGVQFKTSGYSLSLNYLSIKGTGSELTDYLIDASSGSVSLTSVVFEDITLSDKCLLNALPTGYGIVFKGIKRSDAGTANTPAASVFILDATSLADKTQISFSDMSFESCTGAKTGLGGAVYLQIPATVTEVSFDSRPFTGTPSQPEEGRYLYLDVTAIPGFVKDSEALASLRPLVADTTDHLITLAYLDGETKKTEDLHRLLGITTLALTIEKTATAATCTKEKKQCPTITDALSLLQEYGTATGNTITIADGVDISAAEAGTVSVGVHIIGASAKSKVTATPELSQFFLSVSPETAAQVSNLNIVLSQTTEDAPLSRILIYPSYYSELTLSDVDVSGADSKQAYSSASIIATESGKITLSSVTISGITMIASYSYCPPLLRISTEEGLFSIAKTSTFKNIISKTGEGSVISTTLSRGDVLTLTNAEFINCKTLAGDGGAIYLTINNKAKCTIKDCTFTGCEAGTFTTAGLRAQTNAVYKGGAIYMSLSGVPSVVLAGLTVKDCRATQTNGGNVLYCETDSDDEPLPASFWQTMMAGIANPSEEDWIAVVFDSDGKKEAIKLAQYAGSGEDDDDDGFPVWAIIVIVVGAVLIIAVVVCIIIYFLKCRSKGSSKVEAADKEKGSSPSTSTPPSSTPPPSTQEESDKEVESATDPAVTE